MAGKVRRLPTVVARAMSEKEFQTNVVREAKRHGWLVNHTYRARLADGTWRTTTTYRGYPDLNLIRRGQGLYLELKKVGEKASPEQRRWIALAQTIPGVKAFVVDPTDWPEVLELITAPAPPPPTALPAKWAAAAAALRGEDPESEAMIDVLYDCAHELAAALGLPAPPAP